MTRNVGSAAVIGAGVIGRGITAVFARAGVPVLLLDLPMEGVRNGLAERALGTLVQGLVPVLEPSTARLIVPGNLEDDFDRLGRTDWIVEAIVEEPAVKAHLFERLDWIRKPMSIVSTNTSTLLLKTLASGRSPSFRAHSLATHFFNPPHRMRLVEVAPSADTAPKVLAAVQAISAERLGKVVVTCRDTPGFVAKWHWWPRASAPNCLETTPCKPFSRFPPSSSRGSKRALPAARARAGSIVRSSVAGRKGDRSSTSSSAITARYESLHRRLRGT